MSVRYRLVQWNAFKVRYDLVVCAGIAAFLGVFFAAAAFRAEFSRISGPVLLIRALAACAYLMLHVVLCIGPLSRLDRRFLPLLYNRRHLGVATFLVALAHGSLAVGFYHGFSGTPALVSLLTSNVNYGSLKAFPFETLGILALAILFLMAVTSHDLWLKTLTPRVWKSLHMLVYAAWAAVVMHVALGALQTERGVGYSLFVIAGVAVVGGLHLAAGRREARMDRSAGQHSRRIDAGPADAVEEGRAVVVPVNGRERVAIIRHGGRLSAISNVCAHQGGPLGEGRVIDGRVTCPWHGYQYRPSDGCSPAPFTDRVCTYRLQVRAGRIQLDPAPLPPGTPVEPVAVREEEVVVRA
jgi:nitrite reductase/ring-hydroxylating ferredoxin subunit/DMSO/TMAO reductase YedYZ heme-binding membrane subunit